MSAKLQQFAGGYFHEDYKVEFPSPDAAVGAFVTEFSEETVAAVLSEIDDLLASSMSEAELYQLWINQLGAAYDPSADGITYRDWFAHVRDLLSRPPAG